MFRNHYQAPVLGTWSQVPAAIRTSPRQVLRWGWTSTPPAVVTVTEYEKLPA